MRRGRYYLGRVKKLGQVRTKGLLGAIQDARPVTIGKFTWTITDVKKHSDKKWIFGKLSKFSREGHVTLVDIDRRSQVDTIAPNLLISSSPFVYIPKPSVKLTTLYKTMSYDHCFLAIPSIPVIL